ncbi:MAG: hypothetical protein IJ206_06680 [Oscillospiraceae bacterium]|nr:hypothetical protein [Oscillospiraceae bacterium]
MALALILILTGLGFGQAFAAYEADREPVFSGAASILPHSGIPHPDLFFQESQHNTIQPVLRAKTVSKLETLRNSDSSYDVTSMCMAAYSFGPVWYAADLVPFAAPSWRAIVSLIHRTRKKSR